MVDSAEKKFREVAEKVITPVYKEYQTLEVELFTEGCLIDEYARIEYKSIEYALENKVAVGFTENEFIDYCRTLISTRIHYVRGERRLFAPTDDIVFPSFLEVTANQIGRVRDNSIGVELIPAEYSGHELSLAHVQMISARLESIKGYACGFGYSNSKNGSWDFMTMSFVATKVVEDGVETFKYDIANVNAKPHPVYALIAAVLGPKLICSALNPLNPLVTYGSTNLYEGLLWQLTSI